MGLILDYCLGLLQPILVYYNVTWILLSVFGFAGYVELRPVPESAWTGNYTFLLYFHFTSLGCFLKKIFIYLDLYPAFSHKQAQGR